MALSSVSNAIATQQHYNERHKNHLTNGFEIEIDPV